MYLTKYFTVWHQQDNNVQKLICIQEHPNVPRDLLVCRTKNPWITTVRCHQDHLAKVITNVMATASKLFSTTTSVSVLQKMAFKDVFLELAVSRVVASSHLIALSARQVIIAPILQQIDVVHFTLLDATHLTTWLKLRTRTTPVAKLEFVKVWVVSVRQLINVFLVFVVKVSVSL